MKYIKNMIELRDLFVILVLIFLCYQQIQLWDLRSRIQELFVGEHLQNEINTEIVKRLYLHEHMLDR